MPELHLWKVQAQEGGRPPAPQECRPGAQGVGAKGRPELHLAVTVSALQGARLASLSGRVPGTRAPSKLSWWPQEPQAGNVLPPRHRGVETAAQRRHQQCVEEAAETKLPPPHTIPATSLRTSGHPPGMGPPPPGFMGSRGGKQAGTGAAGGMSPSPWTAGKPGSITMTSPPPQSSGSSGKPSILPARAEFPLPQPRGRLGALCSRSSSLDRRPWDPCQQHLSPVTQPRPRPPQAGPPLAYGGVRRPEPQSRGTWLYAERVQVA